MRHFIHPEGRDSAEPASGVEWQTLGGDGRNVLAAPVPNAFRAGEPIPLTFRIVEVVGELVSHFAALAQHLEKC
ncbi:hypothetical protein D3C85_1801760 [compost metagenome]